jgi:hypothetical protein
MRPCESASYGWEAAETLRDGILYNDHEAGAIGPRLFGQACKIGLEGIVSKHRDRTYKPGLSPHWIKVKNPEPANRRASQGYVGQPR